MFKHRHPYKPFILNNTEKLIVGTLPPPRFSAGELLEKDVNFCYGSYYNSLWLYIDRIYNLNLKYDNSKEAIEERKQFLTTHNIGVCDIVESCERKKVDASDLGMTNIKLRDVVGYLRAYPNIHTLLFTGGNSKNGPEYFFRKHLRDYGLKMEMVSNEIPRIHQFKLPTTQNPIDVTYSMHERIIKTVSLTSPSGSANRAIGSMKLYQELKAEAPSFTAFDFRVLQYSAFF